MYSWSAKSYSNANSSNSLLLPKIVSSKNWTDTDELINGLFVVAKDNVLKELVDVGVPESDLDLM